LEDVSSYFVVLDVSLQSNWSNFVLPQTMIQTMFHREDLHVIKKYLWLLNILYFLRV